MDRVLADSLEVARPETPLHKEDGESAWLQTNSADEDIFAYVCTSPLSVVAVTSIASIAIAIAVSVSVSVSVSVAVPASIAISAGIVSSGSIVRNRKVDNIVCGGVLRDSHEHGLMVA